jgi:hypothetical protein
LTADPSADTVASAHGGEAGKPPPGLPEAGGEAGKPPPGLPEAGAASPGGVGWEPGTSSGTPISSRKPSWSSNYHVTGEARQVQQRGDVGNETVWTFRIQRYDAAGNRLQPVPVEMRGMRFKGSIGEGDIVQLPGRWQPGSIACPHRVKNLSTGCTVKAGTPLSVKIVQVIVLLIVLLIVGFVVRMATK